MISVCMASFNGEKYIEEQIQSILCQLGENDELIISDDLSTDRTVSIIQSIDDDRIRLIMNPTNHGYTGNFYDPIPLHQWRSLAGSWLITEENGIKYLEQNRGDNTKGAFLSTYPTLTHKCRLFSSYTISVNIRLFEVTNYAGIAFNYLTSRNKASKDFLIISRSIISYII